MRCFVSVEERAFNHLMRQRLQLLDCLHIVCFHIKRKWCSVCLQELVSEGPVPWVSKNSVTSVAEQVSHHPPISAFYAECFIKKIQFCAHIWTKSKFLRMSIGVHNTGQGCVSCLEHNEHCILTFPGGCGRSVLTVPWVELGGESKINCSKTGYSANIVFHTKPFYGGKKHRITAEIL